jgi:hypothetical protein
MAVNINDIKKGFRGDLAKIHYKGIFDMDGMYKLMRAWFANHLYEDFYENLYKEKIPELELEWKAVKKLSGYIKHVVYISFHGWGFHDVEVIEDGVKKKKTEGRFTLTFNAELLLDYEGAWEVERSWWRKKLKYFYENFIIKKELLANQYDELANEVRELQDKIKEHLGMEGVQNG